MGSRPTVEYENDASISDGEILYRRVRSDLWHWQEGRPASGAFDDSGDGSPMSVALHSLLEAAGMEPQDLLRDLPPQFGLVRFTVGFARSLGLAVTSMPPVAGQPAHGWVSGKKTRSRQKRLATNCEIEIQPPPI